MAITRDQAQQIFQTVCAAAIGGLCGDLKTLATDLIAVAEVVNAAVSSPDAPNPLSQGGGEMNAQKLAEQLTAADAAWRAYNKPKWDAWRKEADARHAQRRREQFVEFAMEYGVAVPIEEADAVLTALPSALRLAFDFWGDPLTRANRDPTPFSRTTASANSSSDPADRPASSSPGDSR